MTSYWVEIPLHEVASNCAEDVACGLEVIAKRIRLNGDDNLLLPFAEDETSGIFHVSYGVK
jgi:hypothetical protein